MQKERVYLVYGLRGRAVNQRPDMPLITAGRKKRACLLLDQVRLLRLFDMKAKELGRVTPFFSFLGEHDHGASSPELLQGSPR